MELTGSVPSLDHQKWDLVRSRLCPDYIVQVFSFYLTTARTRLSGLRSSSPPPILSCQLWSLSGRGSLCKYAGCSRAVAGPIITSLTQHHHHHHHHHHHGVNLEFQWAGRSWWEKQVLPALQFKCPARAVCVGGPLGGPGCESCSVLLSEGKISNVHTVRLPGRLTLLCIFMGWTFLSPLAEITSLLALHHSLTPSVLLRWPQPQP